MPSVCPQSVPPPRFQSSLRAWPLAPPGPSPLPHHIGYPSVPFSPCVLWLGPQVAPGVLKEQVCLFSLGLISERGGELRGVTPLFPEP